MTGYHLRPIAATAYVGGRVDLQLILHVTERSGRAPPKAGKPDASWPPWFLDTEPPTSWGCRRFCVCEGDEGVDELAPLVGLNHVVWKVDGPGRIDGSDKVASTTRPRPSPAATRR